MNRQKCHICQKEISAFQLVMNTGYLGEVFNCPKCHSKLKIVYAINLEKSIILRPGLFFIGLSLIIGALTITIYQFINFDSFSLIAGAGFFVLPFVLIAVINTIAHAFLSILDIKPGDESM